MVLSEEGNDIYPSRYNLDIVANKEWYESKGVEQVFVIVLRDQSISAESREEHCNNAVLKAKEEVRYLEEQIATITENGQ